MIGVDLVYIPEFQRLLDLGGAPFLNKVFNESEMKNQKVEHLAGLWAAKEAVAKAAIHLPQKMTDIHILHDGQGKPSAKVGSYQFAVSIAHHGEYAVAVAQRIEL